MRMCWEAGAAVNDSVRRSPPNGPEIVAEFARRFPECRLSEDERRFLSSINVAAWAGVGYGFMRQAIGLTWKLHDPVGYIDDERIIELHAPRKRTRKKKT